VPLACAQVPFRQFLACSHSARARQYYNEGYIQPLLSIHNHALASRLALRLRGNRETFVVAAFGQDTNIVTG
jgi:hypothetical protein